MSDYKKITIQSTDYGFEDSKSREDISDLKSAIRCNDASDSKNISALFSSVTDVHNGNENVPFNFFAGMVRGSVTGGLTPSTSTRRCYAKFPLTSQNEKIYFDDSKYKINVAWAISGEYGNQSGWISSSPWTNSNAQSYDYVYVTVDSQNGTDVVDLFDASETTYFQKNSTVIKDVPVVYVSNSGNDINSGDAEHPLATINKALEKGATRILIASGDYRQQIDLSKSKTGKVEILKASESGNVYFRPTSIQVCATETKVDNFSKVYSAPITVTLASNNKWLFQRNNPDPYTLIDNAERMPQQRGYENRLPSTVLRKCASANLNDALNEIENADGYLFYVDNGTIYFSRPTAVNGTNPIAYSSGTKLFLNNSIRNTIIMTGIKTEYMSINIDYTTDSVLTDCSSLFVYGNGAITYDYALNATFIRCEAGATVNGTIGDGINGHGKSGGIVSNYKTTARLFDCWCHDNNDDGFSDHDYCESEIYGGLFEYNGKAGITPSYGSHCVCNGAYSRKNFNGFYYTGAASDGGTYGQLECINCIAEENTRGNAQNNAGFLVDSNGNKLILINCKSINNSIGYYATSSASMALIDCGSSGDTTPKAGAGTRTIIKTETIVP